MRHISLDAQINDTVFSKAALAVVEDWMGRGLSSLTGGRRSLTYRHSTICGELKNQDIGGA